MESRKFTPPEQIDKTPENVIQRPPSDDTTAKAYYESALKHLSKTSDPEEKAQIINLYHQLLEERLLLRPPLNSNPEPQVSTGLHEVTFPNEKPPSEIKIPMSPEFDDLEKIFLSKMKGQPHETGSLEK